MFLAALPKTPPSPALGKRRDKTVSKMAIITSQINNLERGSPFFTNPLAKLKIVID
jgi:hypothetical protein